MGEAEAARVLFLAYERFRSPAATYAHAMRLALSAPSRFDASRLEISASLLYRPLKKS